MANEVAGADFGATNTLSADEDLSTFPASKDGSNTGPPGAGASARAGTAATHSLATNRRADRAVARSCGHKGYKQKPSHTLNNWDEHEELTQKGEEKEWGCALVPQHTPDRRHASANLRDAHQTYWHHQK